MKKPQGNGNVELQGLKLQTERADKFVSGNLPNWVWYKLATSKSFLP